MVISQRLIPTRDQSRSVVAAELITGNVPLWTLIRDNKLFQLPSLLQRGLAHGMIRIEDSLNDLVRRDIISVETARSYADDPKAIGTSGGAVSARPTTKPQANSSSSRRGGIGGLFRKKDA